MSQFMLNRTVIVGIGGLAVIAGLGAALTIALSGTRSTTELNRFDRSTVDGQLALAPNIIAGRTLSKYHPLPWIGRKLSDVSCPTALKAVQGTRITCTGELAAGGSVTIPVRVDAVSSTTITWSFER